MTVVLDQVGRLLRGAQLTERPRCIVCRCPIHDDERSMTVRGSVQVHRRCATYRMRQVDSGVRRVGYPPR
jgi:hypothetical protein